MVTGARKERSTRLNASTQRAGPFPVCTDLPLPTTYSAIPSPRCEMPHLNHMRKREEQKGKTNFCSAAGLPEMS